MTVSHFLDLSDDSVSHFLDLSDDSVLDPFSVVSELLLSFETSLFEEGFDLSLVAHLHLLELVSFVR